MFHHYLSKMYEIPSYIYFIMILTAIVAWAFLDKRYQQKRHWRVINQALFFLALAAILTITILVRGVQETDVYLNPLHVFKLAKQFPDVYNQMVLNIVLFLPIGLTLPFAFKFKYTVTITVLFSLVYSLFIEYLQYFLQRGYFDTSDLILNVFGASLGVLASVISHKVLKQNSN